MGYLDKQFVIYYNYFRHHDFVIKRTDDHVSDHIFLGYFRVNEEYTFYKTGEI